MKSIKLKSKTDKATIRALILAFIVIFGVFVALIIITNNQDYKQLQTVSLSQNTNQIDEKVNNAPEPMLLEYEIPSGWSVKSRSETFPSVYEFSKGLYNIVISQPIEGGFCVFPDSKKMDGPAVSYTKYSEVKTEYGIIRMAKSDYKYSDGLIHYQSCIKDINSKPPGVYMPTTPIGSIEYVLPADFDQKFLNEMNNFIKTIKVEKS